MLTRLYIDNFRCFVNFEYRPARKQLILGSNGTGKSSLLDALLFLRQFAVKGLSADDFPILNHRTRWAAQLRQTFELEASLDGASFLYRLVIEPWGDPVRARVVEETVSRDGKPIFEFTMGEVQLYNDRFEHGVTYPFDWHRSALATIMPRKDNQVLSRFTGWLGGLFCFRLNPQVMGVGAAGEDPYPNLNMSNLAAWYRHLIQVHPKHNAAMLDSLRASVDALSYLKFYPAGENISLLVAEFANQGAANAEFGFNELSDGQRCLICLYAILHFVVARGQTVIIDEPENYISLREIQPWLMAVEDSVEENQGQVLLISHHPELINQWAPSCGVQFVREGIGPVRVKGFHGEPESSLSPAELVARGWENG